MKSSSILMKQETLFRPERKPQITTDPSQLSNSIGALPRPPSPARARSLAHSLAGSLVHSLTPRWMIVLAWLARVRSHDKYAVGGGGCGDDGRGAGAGGGVTGEREEPIKRAPPASAASNIDRILIEWRERHSSIDGCRVSFSRISSSRRTEIYFMMRSRFGEVCSCCSYTVLPGPALALLNYLERMSKGICFSIFQKLALHAHVLWSPNEDIPVTLPSL